MLNNCQNHKRMLLSVLMIAFEDFPQKYKSCILIINILNYTYDLKKVKHVASKEVLNATYNV